MQNYILSKLKKSKPILGKTVYSVVQSVYLSSVPLSVFITIPLTRASGCLFMGIKWFIRQSVTINQDQNSSFQNSLYQIYDCARTRHNQKRCI